MHHKPFGGRINGVSPERIEKERRGSGGREGGEKRPCDCPAI